MHKSHDEIVDVELILFHRVELVHKIFDVLVRQKIAEFLEELTQRL